MNKAVKNEFQAACLYRMLAPFYVKFRAGIITESELNYLDWAEAQFSKWF